jgi:hypothetical protein
MHSFGKRETSEKYMDFLFLGLYKAPNLKYIDVTAASIGSCHTHAVKAMTQEE